MSDIDVAVDFGTQWKLGIDVAFGTTKVLG
jgi:hypothetical protein